MTDSAPNAAPTQLVRYVLQIADMTSPDSIAQVRQCLTGLGLLVDRIEAGEAEVAVIPPSNPGPEGIRASLQEAGFAVQDITAQAG